MIAALLAKEVFGIRLGILIPILVIVALCGWLLYTDYRIDSLKAENSALQNQIVVERLVSGHREKALAITADRLVQRTEEVANLNSKLEAIENADESKDGPVSPVLRDALERL